MTLAEADAEGQTHRLISEAAAAWHQLSAAAAQDRVRLMIVSAFRSLQQQAEIIPWKRRRELSMEAILRGSAPPGISGSSNSCTTPASGAKGCSGLSSPFF